MTSTGPDDAVSSPTILHRSEQIRTKQNVGTPEGFWRDLKNLKEPEALDVTIFSNTLKIVPAAAPFSAQRKFLKHPKIPTRPSFFSAPYDITTESV